MLEVEHYKDRRLQLCCREELNNRMELHTFELFETELY